MAAAEFHKMPLLVQTGDVKSMDFREFPSARNARELVRRVATLHGKESPAADTEMSRPLYEGLYRPDGARYDAADPFTVPSETCLRAPNEI